RRHAAQQRRLHHHVQASHARDHTQKLTDIAQSIAAQGQRLTWLSPDHFDYAAVVQYTYAAIRRQVVAIERTQQGGLSRTRLAMQDQALARHHIKRTI